MIDAICAPAGLRCGLYTKPHLVHLTERTRIDGAEMPARADARIYRAAARDLRTAPDLALTFFEFTVALMFLYFAEAAVDLAVIETGLGGRLDSTNVVHPAGQRDHADRLRSHGSPRLHHRGDRRREGRHHQARRAGRDRRARPRGAPWCSAIDCGPAAQSGPHDRARLLVRLARPRPSLRLSRGWGSALDERRARRWPDRFSMRTPRSRWRRSRRCGRRAGDRTRRRYGADSARWYGRAASTWYRARRW